MIYKIELFYIIKSFVIVYNNSIMTDKFLSTGGGGNANISNGSVNIFAATLAADNLEPSKAIKTNSVKQLISTNLEIADINNLQSELNNVISNPFAGTLQADDFKGDSIKDKTETSTINLTATEIDLVATSVKINGQPIDNSVTLQDAYDNQPNGDLQLSTSKNLNIKAVDNSSIFNIDGDTKNIDVNGTIVLNGNNVETSIETLAIKTQNQTATPTITEFTGSLLLNGQPLGGADNSTLQSVYNTQADGKILLANNKPFVIENQSGNNFYLDDNSLNVISDSNIWLGNGREFNILTGDPSFPFAVVILQATQNDIKISQLICDNITPQSTNSNIGSVLNPYQQLYLSERIQAGSKIIDLLQPNSIGVNVPIKTTQDVFNDDELVDKKYVDDSIQNIPPTDLTDLETKTQNISLTTTSGQTDIEGVINNISTIEQKTAVITQLNNGAGSIVLGTRGFSFDVVSPITVNIIKLALLDWGDPSNTKQIGLWQDGNPTALYTGILTKTNVFNGYAVENITPTPLSQGRYVIGIRFLNGDKFEPQANPPASPEIDIYGLRTNSNSGSASDAGFSYPSFEPNGNDNRASFGNFEFEVIVQPEIRTTKIIGLSLPTDDFEASNKKYVDDSISNIPLPDLTVLETKTANINLASTATNTDFNGGFVSNGNVTFNGVGAFQLNINGPVQLQNSSTLQIQPSGSLFLKSCSILGQMDMTNNKIINVTNPTNAGDAVNKNFFDANFSAVTAEINELKDKTQNIDLGATDGTKTVMTQDLILSGGLITTRARLNQSLSNAAAFNGTRGFQIEVGQDPITITELLVDINTWNDPSTNKDCGVWEYGNTTPLYSGNILKISAQGGVARTTVVPPLQCNPGGRYVIGFKSNGDAGDTNPTPDTGEGITIIGGQLTPNNGLFVYPGNDQNDGRALFGNFQYELTNKKTLDCGEVLIDNIQAATINQLSGYTAQWGGTNTNILSSDYYELSATASLADRGAPDERTNFILPRGAYVSAISFSKQNSGIVGYKLNYTGGSRDFVCDGNSGVVNITGLKLNAGNFINIQINPTTSVVASGRSMYIMYFSQLD